jgi:hypothetical protein
MSAEGYESAYAHLIKKHGEDAAREKIEKYQKQVGGAMPFEAAALVVAAMHGWKTTVRPKAPYKTHLSDDWLENYVEYETYNGMPQGTTDFEGEVAAIGQIQEREYKRKNGEQFVVTYLDVVFRDEGWERSVRMLDRDPFTSSKGNQIMGSYMLTLFDNLRAAVGQRMRVTNIKVKRITDASGMSYLFESTNFTEAFVAKDPHAAEVQDIEGDGTDDFDDFDL